jgi:hypothetical protein
MPEPTKPSFKRRRVEGEGSIKTDSKKPKKVASPVESVEALSSPEPEATTIAATDIQQEKEEEKETPKTFKDLVRLIYYLNART